MPGASSSFFEPLSMPALATCACLIADWHKVTGENQLRTAELVARAKVFLVATYHLNPQLVPWHGMRQTSPAKHQNSWQTDDPSPSAVLNQALLTAREHALYEPMIMSYHVPSSWDNIGGYWIDNIDSESRLAW